jgi:hypothetical protein
MQRRERLKAERQKELADKKAEVDNARQKIVNSNVAKRTANDAKEQAQRDTIEAWTQRSANVQGKTVEQVKAEANDKYQKNLREAEKASKARARDERKGDKTTKAQTCGAATQLQKDLNGK